jgi:putative membrane protein
LQVVKASIPVLIDKILAQVEGALLPKIGVPAANCDPKSSLRCASAALTAGAAALATGTSTLNSKVPALSSGVNQLAAGANQLADGSAQVADGTDQLAEGTETLDGKVPALADGVNQLAAGGDQLAAGNEQLATGLTSAADGSGQLADGLAQAEPGGGQIEDGAGRLKKEGADELAKTGKEAQLDYARRVAMLEAAQQAGLEGVAIPFGPAEGTDVVTTAAYKMELAGITSEEENTALKYVMAALLLLAGGLAGVAGVRRIAQ